MQSSLLANVMAPYVAWGVGGDQQISVPFSMLATLLAAVLERPFTQWAGIRKQALLYSIRANILSWFVGLLLAWSLIYLDKMGSLYYGLLFLAVPFSVFIEGTYLTCLGLCQSFKWRPIILGNVFSGLVLWGVLVVGLEWGDRLQLAWSPVVTILRSWRPFMSATVLYGCLAIFLVAMFWRQAPPNSRECSGTNSSRSGRE